MKKVLLIATMLMASAGAFAGDFTPTFGTTATYDYDRAVGVPAYVSAHRGVVDLDVTFGKLGTVSGGLAVDQAVIDASRVNLIGFDTRYKNSVVVGPVTLTGGVDFTRVNYHDAAYVEKLAPQVTGSLVSTTGHADTWRYSLEAKTRIVGPLSGFVGYEYDTAHLVTVGNAASVAYGLGNGYSVGLSEKLPNTNFDASGKRYTVGPELKVTDRITIRGGYARLVAEGTGFNGATASVNVKF